MEPTAHASVGETSAIPINEAKELVQTLLPQLSLSFPITGNAVQVVPLKCIDVPPTAQMSLAEDADMACPLSLSGLGVWTT
jgi:hypothetical protein